jgi:rRNA maturation RNase YbeY
LKLSILYDKEDFTDFLYAQSFRKKINRLVDIIRQKEKKQLFPTTIRFCDSATIIDFNKRFLNHNYATDVITFDYTSIGINYVDILICPDVVKQNAKRFRTSFKSEMLRVIAHSFLHLCGYNDSRPSEKKAMRQRENFYLKSLNIDE